MLLLIVYIWGAIVAGTMALLGAPGWAIFLAVIVAAQGYSNQIQITQAREEAARR